MKIENKKVTAHALRSRKIMIEEIISMNEQQALDLKRYEQIPTVIKELETEANSIYIDMRNRNKIIRDTLERVDSITGALNEEIEELEKARREGGNK